MTPSQDADLAALESLSSRLTTALEAIENHQWTMATPCSDWDLAALVDHVTGGNWFTRRIFDDRSAEDAMNQTIALFQGASVTGEQAASSVAEQLAAFRKPGALDRTYHHMSGDLTGRQILRLRLHDLIVHTWDIDQTLAPPAPIPEDLVRWGLEELANDDSLTLELFDVDTTPVPQTAADFQTGYLLRFGR